MTLKVISILGASYSGSTVLGALLGGHPDVICVGELARWTRYSNPGVRRCACGELVAECPFWTEIEQAWEPLAGEDGREAYASLQRRFERIRDLPVILLQGGQPGSAFRAYGGATRALLQAIARIAEHDTLVDTSKLPARALAMSRTEGIDTRFVHLVRDPRAFLASCVKREPPAVQADTESIGLGLAYRVGLRWAAANLAAEATIRAVKRPWQRIRYEAMVKDISGSLRLLSEVVGVDLAEIGERVAAGTEMTFGHMVAGNDVRLNGPVAFRDQIPTMNTMSTSAANLFRLLTHPLAKRYGY